MSLYQSANYYNLSPTNLVGITVALLCLVAYAQFSWNRRKMYRLASKLKGPLSLPFIGCAYLAFRSPTDFSQLLFKLCDRYGNGVRAWLGFKLIVGIFDANDVGTILNSPKCLEKDSVYHVSRILVGNGVFSAPASVWKVHKKLILPSFNQRILDGFVRAFVEKSSVLVEKLKNVCNKGEIDVLTLLTNCSLDILSETTLGWKGDFQNDGAIHAKNFSVIMEAFWFHIVYIHYHFDVIFKRSELYKKMSVARDFIITMTNKIIKEKVEKFEATQNCRIQETDESDKKGKLAKAFLDSLIENTYIEKKLTSDDIRDEVITFIIAGTDTTAYSSCYTFLLLALHQDVQNKVYEEVMEVVGPDGEICPRDLPNLKYLERVIKESLRLFPIAGVIGRSVQDDIKLGSFTLPAGATAAITIFKVHRNPKYWSDPEKFNPDRFLPDEVAKRHPYAYIPFSGGPRNCLGFRFAMMAIKTIVAYVVRQYKICTTYKSIDEVELLVQMVLKPAKGFKISMKPR